MPLLSLPPQLYALFSLDLCARKTALLSFNHAFGMDVAFWITGTLGIL